MDTRKQAIAGELLAIQLPFLRYRISPTCPAIPAGEPRPATVIRRWAVPFQAAGQRGTKLSRAAVPGEKKPAGQGKFLSIPVYKNSYKDYNSFALPRRFSFVGF